MADVKKIVIQPKSKCNCAKSQILFEFSFPLNKSDLDFFLKRDFKSVNSYTNIGMFYIEDNNMIAVGPFGTNKLQIKCKNKACDESISKFEELLKIMH